MLIPGTQLPTVDQMYASICILVEKAVQERFLKASLAPVAVKPEPEPSETFIPQVPKKKKKKKKNKKKSSNSSGSDRSSTSSSNDSRKSILNIRKELQTSKREQKKGQQNKNQLQVSAVLKETKKNKKKKNKNKKKESKVFQQIPKPPPPPSIILKIPQTLPTLQILQTPSTKAKLTTTKTTKPNRVPTTDEIRASTMRNSVELKLTKQTAKNHFIMGVSGFNCPALNCPCRLFSVSEYYAHLAERHTSYDCPPQLRLPVCPVKGCGWVSPCGFSYQALAAHDAQVHSELKGQKNPEERKCLLCTSYYAPSSAAQIYHTFEAHNRSGQWWCRKGCGYMSTCRASWAAHEGTRCEGSGSGSEDDLESELYDFECRPVIVDL